MSSEIYSYLYEKVLEEGALDIYTESIYMKKNRPAYRLTVVCSNKSMHFMPRVRFRQVYRNFTYRNKYFWSKV